jgi:hypothetical protein
VPARLPLNAYLEQQRALLAGQAGTRAASTRQRVRSRCSREGIETPDWAQAAFASRNVHARRGAPRPKPRACNLTFASKRAEPREPAGPAPVIPAELSAWRATHPGSCVSVSAEGRVSLFAYGSPVRKFESVEAAIAAV